MVALAAFTCLWMLVVDRSKLSAGESAELGGHRRPPRLPDPRPRASAVRAALRVSMGWRHVAAGWLLFGGVVHDAQRVTSPSSQRRHVPRRSGGLRCSRSGTAPCSSHTVARRGTRCIRGWRRCTSPHPAPVRSSVRPVSRSCSRARGCRSSSRRPNVRGNERPTCAPRSCPGVICSSSPSSGCRTSSSWLISGRARRDAAPSTAAPSELRESRDEAVDGRACGSPERSGGFEIELVPAGSEHRRRAVRR